MAGRSGRRAEGSAALVLSSSVVHLHPEEAVFEAMLAGWTAQQTARLLGVTTIESRVAAVRRFAAFAGEYPWRWQPADVEDWTVSLRRGGAQAHSTLRNYQNTIAMFCDYLVDPRYEWASECEARFGTHPVQICHEWNTATHVADHEGRPAVRPFTRDELQAFFDHADAQVERAQRLARKGWTAAFRDAALFKTIYAFGLRRREAVMLDVTDFHTNAKAPQFGPYGICSVRYGKAMKGSPPRRRSVLTVMDWSVDVLTEYVEEVRPLYGVGQRPMLWPTERGGRVSTDYVNVRFREYRDALGLPAELHPHCLRHAYVTHLIEDDFDLFFVQQQVGHAWGSTTALYTGVSSDYKNRALAAALGPAFTQEEGEQG
jgi:integrase/recombinase XerC